MASRSNETAWILNLGSKNESSHMHIQGVSITFHYFFLYVLVRVMVLSTVQSCVSTRGNRAKSSPQRHQVQQHIA